MTAGWVLPRDWDAARLLRFLTGLALLALAFAANAGLIAPPVDAAPAAPVTIVDVSAVDTAADVDQAPVSIEPAAITGPVIEIGATVVSPVPGAEPPGVVPGTHGSRGPPAV